MNCNPSGRQELFASACPLCDQPQFLELVAFLYEQGKFHLGLPALVHCENCGDVFIDVSHDA